MKTSRSLSSCCFVLALGLLSAALARAEPVHAIMTDNGPFWSAVARGMNAPAAVVKVIVPPVSGPSAQIRYLQLAAEQRPKVVLFNPYWLAETKPAIEALATQGVRIVTLDNELPTSIPHVYVGHNKARISADVGKFVAGLIGDADEVSLLRIQNEKSLTQREQAAIDAIRAAHPKTAIHADVFGAETAEKVYPQVKTLLTKYPKTKLLLTTNTVHSLGALKAIREVAPAGGIKLVGYGTALPAEAAEALRDGTLYAWIAQDPAALGRRAMAVINDLLEGKTVEPTTYVDAVFVTKENVNDPAVAALQK